MKQRLFGGNSLGCRAEKSQTFLESFKVCSSFAVPFLSVGFLGISKEKRTP